MPTQTGIKVTRDQSFMSLAMEEPLQLLFPFMEPAQILEPAPVLVQARPPELVQARPPEPARPQSPIISRPPQARAILLPLRQGPVI